MNYKVGQKIKYINDGAYGTCIRCNNDRRCFLAGCHHVNVSHPVVRIHSARNDIYNNEAFYLESKGRKSECSWPCANYLDTYWVMVKYRWRKL